MAQFFPRYLALFASMLVLTARAQETAPVIQPDGTPPKAIVVEARKNAGNLRYRFFLDGQKRLQGYLPPEPRMLDVMHRISFTELPMPEQDAYAPKGWAVAVVSDSVDQAVPVRRGGYFWLPEIPLAYEQAASIMFKEQSRRKALDVGWIIRVGADQRLPYADFGKAMAEIRSVQKSIPIYHISVITEKLAKYDGMKACFLDPGGTVLIDGKPAADATVGNCAVLKFDPAKAGRGQLIEFKGPLDIVTVVETAKYLPTSS